jgi:hypothetical protein
MAEIQKTQIFNMTPERCFEGLRRVFPILEVAIKRSDPVTRTLEAVWSPGGMQIILRAVCMASGDGTEVTLSQDIKWTPVLSRPMLAGEKESKKLNDKVNQMMSAVFEMLEKFLQDENSLPKLAPVAGLDLDHVAWIIGAVVSLGLRSVAIFLLPNWIPSLTQTADGAMMFMRLAGVAGVLVGALTAGLLKRRKPLRGNAFFEGLIISILHIWFSMLFSKTYFTMGCVDWTTYMATGIIIASIASMKFRKSTE